MRVDPPGVPETTRDGTTLHYELAGPDAAPDAPGWVVLLGEAGLGPWQWGWQHDALATTCRTLVCEYRGHGSSGGSPDSVRTLAADVEAVLRDAGADRVSLVGVGLGGMVALRYAREFDRARRLVLCGTAASGEAVDPGAFESLFESPDALDGLFSPAFCEARPDLAERIADWRREEDAPEPVREAALEAMEAFDAGPLYELSIPALVLHGLADPVVAREAGESLAEGLPRGRFEAVEGRHLCHAEHAAAVTDELLAFLEARVA